MLDLRQLAYWLAANPLGRAVGRDQLGMGRFEPLELVQQPIVLEIADLRVVENVILAIVKANLVAQLLDPLLRSGAHAVRQSGRADRLEMGASRRTAFRRRG